MLLHLHEHKVLLADVNFSVYEDQKNAMLDRIVMINFNYSSANYHSTSQSKIPVILDKCHWKCSALYYHLSVPYVQQSCLFSPACRSHTTARLYRSEQTRELRRGSAELYSPTSKNASATSKYKSPISSGFCSTRVVKRGFKKTIQTLKAQIIIENISLRHGYWKLTFLSDDFYSICILNNSPFI